MRISILLILFVFLNSSLNSQVNLGTIHMRNTQYIISFDKVMLPGYFLKFENFVLREYLMGSKLKENVISVYFSAGDSIDVKNKEGRIYADMYIDGKVVYFDGSLVFNDNYELVQESYNIYADADEDVNQFSSFNQFSTTAIIYNKFEGDSISERQEQHSIDFETNSVSTVESILKRRKINPNEIGDIDGNVYRTVVIGDQQWMAENLRVLNFNNGDPIQKLNEAQWPNTTSAGLISESKSGHFYNFYTLIDDRNVCPQGYHVPNEKDIADLYNEITPYDEKIKIGYNQIKHRAYARAFAPIVIPAAVAAQLTWWSIAAAVDVSLLSTAAVLDAAYLIPWSLIDMTIIGPVFGWSSNKKQTRENAKYAQKNYSHIDTNGMCLKMNKKGKWSSTEFFAPKSTWDGFKLAMVQADSSLMELDNKEILKSMKTRIETVRYPLTYKMFPTLKFKPFVSRLVFELLDDASGFFYVFENNIMPYTGNFEEERGGNWSSDEFNISRSRMPVLSLLLSEGSSNEFGNQFKFSLNHDNVIVSPKGFTKGFNRNTLTGITYSRFGELGFWTLVSKKEQHELEVSKDILYLRQNNPLMLNSTSTRIRCVAD